MIKSRNKNSVTRQLCNPAEYGEMFLLKIMIYWWSGFWSIYCLFGFWSICCHRCRLFRSFSESSEIHFFVPIILFRKVKIADIILDKLHISFCIILDYIFLTDNIHFLFLAIIFFILSLLQLLLKRKGGSYKSYQLSFLFSIMLHYKILMDHVLVPNFWRNFSVGISIPSYYRPNFYYLFRHLLSWCTNHNLFVHNV